MATVIGGVPTPPTSPAPGAVNSGAVTDPTVSPAAAAATATMTCSASSTEATSTGVAPTALRSPTRRI